jgi:hypothetical protein
VTGIAVADDNSMRWHHRSQRSKTRPVSIQRIGTRTSTWRGVAFRDRQRLGASDCSGHVIHLFPVGLALRGTTSPLGRRGCCMGTCKA